MDAAAAYATISAAAIAADICRDASLPAPELVLAEGMSLAARRAAKAAAYREPIRLGLTDEDEIFESLSAIYSAVDAAARGTAARSPQRLLEQAVSAVRTALRDGDHHPVAERVATEAVAALGNLAAL
jgi:hypothetical protein